MKSSMKPLQSSSTPLQVSGGRGRRVAGGEAAVAPGRSGCPGTRRSRWPTAAALLHAQRLGNAVAGALGGTHCLAPPGRASQRVERRAGVEGAVHAAEASPPSKARQRSAPLAPQSRSAAHDWHRSGCGTAQSEVSTLPASAARGHGERTCRSKANGQPRVDAVARLGAEGRDRPADAEVGLALEARVARLAEALVAVERPAVELRSSGWHTWFTQRRPLGAVALEDAGVRCEQRHGAAAGGEGEQGERQGDLGDTQVAFRRAHQKDLSVAELPATPAVPAEAEPAEAPPAPPGPAACSGGRDERVRRVVALPADAHPGHPEAAPAAATTAAAARARRCRRARRDRRAPRTRRSSR